MQKFENFACEVISVSGQNVHNQFETVELFSTTISSLVTKLYLRGINRDTPEELHFFWNPEVGIQTNIIEIDYVIPST
jgi:hypothetical protein